MGELEESEQLELGLEIRERVPPSRWAWVWAFEQEAEGNQDTGWWGA